MTTDPDDRRFGFVNAVRFLWHMANTRNRNVHFPYFDVRADAVRCKCGMTFDSNRP